MGGVKRWRRWYPKNETQQLILNLPCLTFLFNFSIDTWAEVSIQIQWKRRTGVTFSTVLCNCLSRAHGLFAAESHGVKVEPNKKGNLDYFHVFRVKISWPRKEIEIEKVQIDTDKRKTFSWSWSWSNSQIHSRAMSLTKVEMCHTVLFDEIKSEFRGWWKLIKKITLLEAFHRSHCVFCDKNHFCARISNKLYTCFCVLKLSNPNNY